MLYCRMKICNIKGCLCNKVRFFLLNCVGFCVQGVRETGGNLCFIFFAFLEHNQSGFYGESYRSYRQAFWNKRKWQRITKHCFAIVRGAFRSLLQTAKKFWMKTQVSVIPHCCSFIQGEVVCQLSVSCMSVRLSLSFLNHVCIYQQR